MSMNLARLQPLGARGRHISLAPPTDPDDDPTRAAPFDRTPAGREDLPYRVEVWNETKTVVEQVLAVTANASIGYAAYYAAIREHPDRLVTLRHRKSVVARSGIQRQ